MSLGFRLGLSTWSFLVGALGFRRFTFFYEHKQTNQQADEKVDKCRTSTSANLPPESTFKLSRSPGRASGKECADSEFQ